IRMGLYTWLLIDNDLLYPHNLSRHALDSYSLGYPKVNVLAYSANILLNDNISKPMVSNIINDGDAGLTEINRYDVILNFSASRAVSRYLSNNNILIKRCISSFINQMGTDLIILVEDLKRNVKLDSLEMQYYRYVANEPLLQNHFKANNVEVRYSTSCSDYSNRLPQDYMSMHAAIASHALPSIITDETPKILIWSANKEMAVKLYKDILVYPTKEIQCGVWKIKYDDGLIDCIYKYRNRKLPNETGGVLVGSYDMFRKIIYVVDTIKSPPDSEEWPNSYIRGCKGLQEKVKLIQVVTGGHLNYIGEWHSHPEGCGSDKSDLDDKALRSLASEINKNGVPALIMIAGNKYNFYLS
ncbi:MAG: Mov34/MPN/PAD-1 family protein, partial [Candidatus Edwardsbacteria bacterium]|nr:Mov34/MPN/PAD-1 family protein [Candidatus Edwardsbacteria bacterium]